jgi:hypothetical protein
MLTCRSWLRFFVAASNGKHSPSFEFLNCSRASATATLPTLLNYVKNTVSTHWLCQITLPAYNISAWTAQGTSFLFVLSRAYRLGRVDNITPLLVFWPLHSNGRCLQNHYLATALCLITLSNVNRSLCSNGSLPLSNIEQICCNIFSRTC